MGNNMNKLSKSSSNKKLCGVCAGVANYFNVDPTVIRLIWALVAVFGGFGIILYVIAALAMPYDYEVKE